MPPGLRRAGLPLVVEDGCWGAPGPHLSFDEGCGSPAPHTTVTWTGLPSLAYDDAVISTPLIGPLPLFADVGIPMLVITLPGMIALLLPVILIEGLFVAKRTPFPNGQVFMATTEANVLSTLLGVPLGWCASFAFQAVVVFGFIGVSKIAPSLGEGDGWKSPAADVLGTVIGAAWVGEGPKWTFPVAALALLGPSFLASVWIERKIMRRSLLATAAGSPANGFTETQLRVVVRDANLLSYAFLVCVCLVWLVWGPMHP
jgi:hypothetical protein